MLDVAEARALITTSLSDADLEDVIEREEAWLARRIGPLEGERVETFVTPDGDETLRLTRPAATVAVEDDGGDVTAYSLRPWSDVLPGSLDGASHSWNGDVRVGYTPADELEVKRALVTLVRLTVSETAYQSQAAGGYSAGVDYQALRVVRYQTWRTLLRPAGPTTTRLRSTIPFGGRSVGPVDVTAVLGS